MNTKIVKDFRRLELGEDERKDYLLIEAVAFHDGENANGAVILKEDAKKDIATMIGKPLRALWKNNNPTGHGYDRTTDTFDKDVQNVGYIHNAYIEDEEGEAYKAKVEVVMWKSYFPEIAKRLVQLHSTGDLHFSVEVQRDVEQLKNGAKRCVNNLFRGLSIVARPAWNGTHSLMVAEDEVETEATLKEESVVEEKEAKDEGMATKVFQEKMENISLKNELEGLTKRLQEYERVVGEFQREKLGRQRYETVGRYLSDESTAEELGKMTEAQYLGLLEQTLQAVGRKEENAEKKPTPHPVISGLFDKTPPTEESDKDALMAILRGLGN